MNNSFNLLRNNVYGYCQIFSGMAWFFVLLAFVHQGTWRYVVQYGAETQYGDSFICTVRLQHKQQNSSSLISTWRKGTRENAFPVHTQIPQWSATLTTSKLYSSYVTPHHFYSNVPCIFKLLVYWVLRPKNSRIQRSQAPRSLARWN